jgi:hypothetical protein
VHKRIISAVEKVEFLSGRICHIIILNVQAQTKNKTDYVKDSFCEELELVFNKFPK